VFVVVVGGGVQLLCPYTHLASIGQVSLNTLDTGRRRWDELSQTVGFST